jgi:hypothetical protein
VEAEAIIVFFKRKNAQPDPQSTAVNEGQNLKEFFAHCLTSARLRKGERLLTFCYGDFDLTP